MRNEKIKISAGQLGKIAVILPYAQHPADNPSYIRKIKSIRGYRWKPEQKCWIFPKSQNILKKLCNIFKNQNIWVDPFLTQIVGQTFRGCPTTVIPTLRFRGDKFTPAEAGVGIQFFMDSCFRRNDIGGVSNGFILEVLKDEKTDIRYSLI